VQKESIRKLALPQRISIIKPPKEPWKREITVVQKKGRTKSKQKKKKEKTNPDKSKIEEVPGGPTLLVFTPQSWYTWCPLTHSIISKPGPLNVLREEMMTFENRVTGTGHRGGGGARQGEPIEKEKPSQQFP